MCENKDKKVENLEALDIEMSKVQPADGEDGPTVLDSKQAGAYSSSCGRCYTCGELVKSR